MLFVFFSFSWTECWGDSPVERAPLTLQVGEQRALSIPDLLRYSLGSEVVRALSPKRLQTTVHSSLLLLKGVQIGSTDLWVWKKSGGVEYRKIFVLKSFLPKKSPDFQKLLNQLTEVEITFTDTGALTQGTVYSLPELTRLQFLIKHYPKQIEDRTQCSEELLQTSQKKLNDWLTTLTPPSQLRIERLDQSLWLRGFLAQPLERTHLIQHGLGIFPALQIDLEALPNLTQTVHFKVFLIEVKKTNFQRLGVTWPEQTQTSARMTPLTLQTTAQLDLTLRHLEGSGEGKVLSSPELVVSIPGEAELFAGGELPITLQNRFYSNVTWKKHGLTLKLKITHTAGNQFRLEVFTEMSHVQNKSPYQNSLPGIQANRMQTHIDAHLDEPIFLSGLFQQNLREDAQGLPFLQHLPVLGRLFRSQDYLNARSELVVILYPHSQIPTPPPENRWVRPKGIPPLIQHPLTPQEIRELQQSKHYPWNVFHTTPFG